MPRNISAAFNTHLQGETTTLCSCWKITRKDNVVQGFTSFNKDLLFESVTYKASSGVIPTDVRMATGTNVDNLAVMGVLDSVQIKELDLINGVYDDAALELFLLNYKDLSQGKLILVAGYLGEVRLGRKKFEAEVRSLIQRAMQPIGGICMPTCRVKRLGDSQCRPGEPTWINAFTFNSTVTSVTSKRVFNASSLGGQVNDYFAYGTLAWTTGLNTGASMEVKRSFTSSGQIELQLPMRNTVAIGDAFTIIAGCDRLSSTCKNKFNNVVNFQGEPYMPNWEKTLRITVV